MIHHCLLLPYDSTSRSPVLHLLIAREVCASASPDGLGELGVTREGSNAIISKKYWMLALPSNGEDLDVYYRVSFSKRGLQDFRAKNNAVLARNSLLAL
jgi:hypothetical protein